MRKRSPLEEEFYNSTVYNVANKVVNEVGRTVSQAVDEAVEQTARNINMNMNKRNYNRVNPPPAGNPGDYNGQGNGYYGQQSRYNDSCGWHPQGSGTNYNQQSQNNGGCYNQPPQSNGGSYNQPPQNNGGSYNQPPYNNYTNYRRPYQGSGPSYPRRPSAPPPKAPATYTAPPKKPKENKGIARFIVSGILIVIGAVILPLDSFIGVAVLAGMGVGGYKLGRYFTTSMQKRSALKSAQKLEKEKQQLLEEQQKAAEEAARKEKEAKARKSTGNPELDAIIAEGDEYIAKLRAANDAIEHEGVSESIDRMEAASKGIFEYIETNPSKIPQIRKFMNYYLPTTLKLLNSYERLSKQAVKGDNISATMFDIEGMMHTIASAFEKQLDGLFSSDAMDIQADIEVFETILTQEGLKDNETKTSN